jgi:broad specificity phosphatase PhoE
VQELDFGDWQDQPLAKLRRQKLWQTVQYQPSNVTFPGGESFRAAQTRAVAAIEQIVQSFDLRKKNYVAVFSHSDMIKLLLAFYVGMPLDSFQRLMVSTGSVSTLCFTPMGVVVAGINQIFK